MRHPLSMAVDSPGPVVPQRFAFFAKLKALLRKAAERSVEDLWYRIARLHDAFLPDECANYFRNAGYAAR